MSQRIITFTHRVNGVLTDLQSVAFGNPASTIGLIRTDTGASVVAAGVALNRNSAGQYSYALTDPSPGLTYDYWITATRSDGTKRWVEFQSAPPSLGGDWHYSNLTGFQDQFGLVNANVEGDLDESGTSTYIVRAGVKGDAYIDGKLRGMGLTLPLQLLNASSNAWMQDLSNYAARWKLHDAREIYDAVVPNAGNNNQWDRDHKYVDDQLAALAGGLVVLVGADGGELAIGVDERDWYSRFGGIEAVTQPCEPVLCLSRPWWAI